MKAQTITANEIKEGDLIKIHNRYQMIHEVRRYKLIHEYPVEQIFLVFGTSDGLLRLKPDEIVKKLSK